LHKELDTARQRGQELTDKLHEAAVLEDMFQQACPAAEDIQRLLSRIGLITNDKENILSDEEEFAAIDEVRDWFAKRPDSNVKNSVSIQPQPRPSRPPCQAS
jgi:DNA mismatch repair ATPase MutS